MLTKKQILILFLISSEPGIRGISSLMKLFDRADFPSNISSNLNELLKNNLITVFENFDNGTAKNYKISESGKNFLIANFNDSEIIEFVENMDEPKLILEITKAYINKKNDR
jgi:hypothetical protein